MVVAGRENLARRMWPWIRRHVTALGLAALVTVSVALWASGALDRSHAQTAWRVHTSVPAGHLVGPGDLVLTEVDVDSLDARLVGDTLTTDELVATRDLAAGELLRVDAVRAADDAMFGVVGADDRALRTTGAARTWWTAGTSLVLVVLGVNHRLDRRRECRQLLSSTTYGRLGQLGRRRRFERLEAARDVEVRARRAEPEAHRRTSLLPRVERQSRG